MNMPMARPDEVDALIEALRTTGAVRVNLNEIWARWTLAAPRLVGDPRQAVVLAAALQELADRGVIELPVGAWDTSTTPPLPRFAMVPTARRPVRSRDWLRFPWRAELGWVASLTTISDTRLRDLIAINDWLARTDGGNVAFVPMRYRSVEILGDEKSLEAMARTNLFGYGRLTLKMLACRRIPPPLPAIVVGSGPDILVVENSDTYWAAAEALSGGSGTVGALAWGSGATFPSQVAALGVDVAGCGPVRGQIWYWGDLDPAGLAIAAAAAAAAAAAHLPEVQPAAGLWAAMAARPVQEAGTVTWTTSSGAGWLGEDLWKLLTPVRDMRGRIAQESVPPAAITAWADSLVWI